MAPGGAASESQEDYLEAILAIIEQKGGVRAKDIAERLGVTSASVTGALRSLSERGLLTHAPYDVIALTARGRKLAADVTRRHRLLHRFLVEVLGVDADEAQGIACRMEHALSPDVTERLARFVGLTEMCPTGGDEWISAVVAALRGVEDPDALRKCIERCTKARRRPDGQGAIAGGD